MTLADELVARIQRASLAELAAAAFLDDGVVAPRGDAAHVADALLDALAQKNQVAAAEPKLAAGIRSELARLFGGAPVAECRARLARLLADALGPNPREVTSAEYSPELQLRVLGLTVDALREPVLDVGCGPDARLVGLLRNLDVTADGIDTRARPGVATRASWLDYDYGVARWGTVTSHLGFTLHFMHQEMKRSDLAYEYGRAYMRIVKSLAPGGTFAYIPGVPFIEAMLPKGKLRVEHVSLGPELLTDAVRRVQEETGLTLDAATHVIAP